MHEIFGPQNCAFLDEFKRPNPAQLMLLWEKNLRERTTKVQGVTLEQGMLVIHWPALFGPGALEQAAEKGFYPLFGLLQAFESVFHRASPYFAELLRRRVQVHAVRDFGVQIPDYLPIYDDREHQILQVWLGQIASKRVPVTEALKHSADDTYKLYVPTGAARKLKQFSKRIPGSDSSEFSIYRVGQGYRPKAEDVPETFSTVGTNQQGFVSGTLNALVTELVVARDIARTAPVFPTLSGAQGMGPTEQSPHDPKLLLVNWRRFFLYRFAYAPERYRAILKPAELDDPTRAAGVLRMMYESKYPALKPLQHGYVYSNLCEARFIGPGRLCEDEEEWRNTTISDLLEFPGVLDTYRRAEIHVNTKLRRRPGATAVAQANRARLEIYIDPATNVSYPFLLYSYGVKHVYISPPWSPAYEHVYEKLQRPRDLAPQDYLRAGVKIFRGFPGRVFFSLEALYRDASSPVATISVLKPWLAEKVNERKFRRDEERTRLRSARRAVGGMRYLIEEDNVIVENYRKGMKQDEWNKIFDVCVGRTKSAVHSRARDLCKKLVLAGERDLKKLPLQRRTGEFLQWFREIKEGKNESETL